MRVLLPLSKKNSNSTGEEEYEEEYEEFEYYSGEESSELVEEEEQENSHVDTVREGAAFPPAAVVAPTITLTPAAVEEPASLPAQEESASSSALFCIPSVSFSASASPTAETGAFLFSLSSSSSPDITAAALELPQNRSALVLSCTKLSPPVQHHGLPREEADQKLPGVCSLTRKELHVPPSELKPAAVSSTSHRTAISTPDKSRPEAEPSLYYDKRQPTRTESKKRPSRHHISNLISSTDGTSDERQCKKKKPPPSSSSAAPAIGPAAAAASAAALPSTTTTTSTAASTNMTAPRNFNHDDEEHEEQGRNSNNNNHGCYFVEENEPPPVYDPNPVPSVAHGAAAAGAPSSSSHAAAPAAPAAGSVPVNARCPLVSHQNYNIKMSGSQKSSHDVPPAATAAAMLQDPAVNNGVDPSFCAALKRQGLEVIIQEGDGNCLFRAVSLQVYGDASMHGQVREQCVNFMAANGDHFGQFVTGEAFADYLQRKRRLGVHGNNPEIQAISELFNRPVEVYEDADVNPVKMNSQGHLVPMNIFQTGYKTSDAPIRLSYHDGNHYNAVVDPLLPTAGLGLGLPGLRPGLADQLQVASAKVESDHTMDLEQAVKESREEQLKGQEDELQRALKESSYSMDTVSGRNAKQHVVDTTRTPVTHALRF
jgi:OTU-like cysteine protease